MKRKEKKPPPAERRCQRGAGSERQCRAARLQGSEFCFFHDPGIRGHRLELHELDEVPLGRSRDLHRLLARAVAGVEQKRLEPQPAYALGWRVQLLRQTLRGLEKERDYHHAQSYGQLVQEALQKGRGGEGGAGEEEEYGPAEAAATEWEAGE